jgi:hypothetical protein
MIPRGVKAFDRGYQGQSGGKTHEEIGGLRGVWHPSRRLQRRQAEQRACPCESPWYRVDVFQQLDGTPHYGDNDESGDACGNGCDGNIRSTSRKGSITTIAMDATRRQSWGKKVFDKMLTTVDDVSAGSTVSLKLAEEIVLQGGVGRVAYYILEALEGQTRE